MSFLFKNYCHKKIIIIVNRLNYDSIAKKLWNNNKKRTVFWKNPSSGRDCWRRKKCLQHLIFRISVYPRKKNWNHDSRRDSGPFGFIRFIRFDLRSCGSCFEIGCILFRSFCSIINNLRCHNSIRQEILEFWCDKTTTDRDLNFLL